jgi:hypothetical protein
MKKILYFMLLGIGLFSACEKGELVENTPYETLAPADPKYAYVKFLNVTPGSPVANYYLDGVKVSAALSSTGVENAGYTYNGVFPDLGYAATSPGAHKLTAKIIPTATADPSLEILNTTITPAAGKYYTYFTSGQYSTTNKTLGTILAIEDVRPALDTAKIFVRFINLGVSSPNVDVIRGETTTTGTKIISNIATGTTSGWVDLPTPGQGTAPTNKYWFVTAGTTTPYVTAVYSGTLTKGRAYTLYLRGINGNTTATLMPQVTFYTTFY